MGLPCDLNSMSLWSVEIYLCSGVGHMSGDQEYECVSWRDWKRRLVMA